jgi:hypothetical protein|tara:strand:+ start:9031 stop:9936 length:906 start_codon:yes stop_codon:yes gene_type:complete
MPKTFVKDGSTVREATKIFVKDGSTVREATKIFVNQGGTIRQVYAKVVVPFQIYLRGTWTKTEGGSSGVGFTGTFTNTTNINTTGTFDPQSGDILLCMQSQTRANSSVSVSQHPTLNSSGAMIAIDSRLGVTYQTVFNSGGKGGNIYTTHRPVYCLSYKVLTGSDTSYSGAQGFDSGGEGNVITFQLYRPAVPLSNSNVTHVGISNPGTSASALSNQTIAAHTTSDVVIQYGASGNASGIGSSAKQTLTDQSMGDLQSQGGTSRSGCAVVSVINTAANAAVGIDRGQSNYLHSGQFRITEP